MGTPRYSTKDHWIKESIKQIFNFGLFWAVRAEEKKNPNCRKYATFEQRYTYRVLQTIQMKRILFCVWAERAVLGSAITVLKFKYEI